MRRALTGWILGSAAALIAFAATPAHAITNLYALQETVDTPGGTLLQYAVGPGGALSPLAPTPIGTPTRDIAVTPDGRFAYVMTSVDAATAAVGATIVPFARSASGRLEPSGPAAGPMGLSSRGLIVNPQGTRVYYGHPVDAIYFRNINADGTLGPENSFPIGNVSDGFTAYGHRFAMTPDGRNLYVAQFDVAGATIVWQLTIDPATGAGVAKNPPSVPFPGGTGGQTAASDGRMAVSPSGSHLYVAADTPGIGIGRWAIDPTTGALGGGTAEAPPTDGYAEAAVALSVDGAALWAPSANGATRAPERIRQFSVSALGTLAPLAPPAVAYVVASAGRDLIPSPDGGSLYLGQSGTVAEWSVGAGGVLSHRANSPAGPDPASNNRGIAITPSQAPVADFTAIPAPAAGTSLFDARASFDPDGTVARYDWDFGDGTSAPNGGSVVGHVYATPGTRTVTLTVTDADGTSTQQLWTGARMLRNGGASAQTTRSVAIAAATAPATAAPPRPRKGRSVTVRAASGKILVRVPGSRKYVPIGDLTAIPLGSIVDARKGKAQITTEVDARTHRTQTAIFYDWYFKVLQTKGRKPITEARLTKGSFASCNRRTLTRSAFVAAARSSKKRSKKKIRRLWGNGKGDFRTGGKRSSATVRGTQWLVEDRCDGTLTRVKQGRVDVRVFRTKKIVKLAKKKGKRSVYIAR